MLVVGNILGRKTGGEEKIFAIDKIDTPGESTAYIVANVTLPVIHNTITFDVIVNQSSNGGFCSIKSGSVEIAKYTNSQQNVTLDVSAYDSITFLVNSVQAGGLSQRCSFENITM